MQVNGGGLYLAQRSALGTLAQVAVNQGSALNLGASTQISALNGGSNGPGTVVLNGNALTVGNNADNISSAFSGVIADGTPAGGSLAKSGTGTFTITGANTYTGGTTVSAGTLAVGPILASNSTTPINTGLVTLSGGTLALTGPRSPWRAQYLQQRQRLGRQQQQYRHNRVRFQRADVDHRGQRTKPAARSISCRSPSPAEEPASRPRSPIKT